ncbi:unnamed protein product [Arabis nemorensis]|uniref:Secreted protein n=1 Tax=Arabis nemorensis TaxID=586526 RepID=A0A565BWW2_9BRAS|nr:unnamed protein product [Arabis nemorensis]
MTKFAAALRIGLKSIFFMRWCRVAICAANAMARSTELRCKAVSLSEIFDFDWAKLAVFGLRGSCKSGDGLVVRHVSTIRDNFKGSLFATFRGGSS